MRISKLERYQGCLVGLAVGDAVGTTVEFKSPGSFPPMTDMVGGGPFNLAKGEWTDDTSMALCLAESLLESKGFNALDQMERYVRWWKEGHLSSNGKCFDIGNTVSSALRNFVQTKNPYSGSTDDLSSGNGSLMRLAPVPLYFASKPNTAISLSAESSKTTHGSRACLDACRYFGGLLVGAIVGRSKEDLLAEKFQLVNNIWSLDPLCDEIDRIAMGSFKEKSPPDIVGSGYVVESLEAALWAFYNSNNFKDGCLLSVNLGRDANTTAAIYGQIAGAFYGYSGIPETWTERIVQRELILDLATRIFQASEEMQNRDTLKYLN